MTNRQLTIDGEDLSDALQYGPTPGLTPFRAFLTDLQETVHKRPRGHDWSVAVGTGSQDCMVRVSQTLTKEDRNWHADDNSASGRS